MTAEGWLAQVYGDIEAHFRAEHLPRVQALCRQPSIAGTGEGIEECARKVMDLLELIGCEDIHLERYVHSPVVVGRAAAGVPDAPTIMMYGMYDVQPAEHLEEWLVPPFDGAILDYPPYGESVVARGIDNSKGPLVCFINAVESIRRVLGCLPVNILFVIEGEEEMGSESLAGYVKAHAEELSKLDAVYLNGTRQDEKGRPFTILGNKGILYLELLCTGGAWGGPKEADIHSAHAAWLSSPAWRLVNALNSMRSGDDILIESFYDDLRPLSQADEALTKRMIEVFDEKMYLEERLTAQRFWKGLRGGEALRSLLWQPTLNIDGIWSGYTGDATKTILPYEARAKLDVRLVPPMEPDRTLSRIRRHLDEHGYEDIQITVRQGTWWSKADPECPAARACVEAMDHSGYPDGSPWPIFPGSGPAYLFTRPPVGVPFVSYGLGISGREHAPNEWMTVQTIQDNEKSAAAFLYYLAKHYAK